LILKDGYYTAPDFIYDLPISSNEKLVLGYLCRRADGTGESFPSRERISTDCSFGLRTVDKYLKKLREAGYIKIRKKNTKITKTNKRVNHYQLPQEIMKIKEITNTNHRNKGGLKIVIDAQNLHFKPAEFAISNAQNLHPKEEQIKDYLYKEENDIENYPKDITTEEEMLSLTKEEIEESMQEWISMDVNERKLIDSQVERLIPFGSDIQMTGEQDEQRNRLRALVIRNQNEPI